MSAEFFLKVSNLILIICVAQPSPFNKKQNVHLFSLFFYYIKSAKLFQSPLCQELGVVLLILLYITLQQRVRIVQGCMEI